MNMTVLYLAVSFSSSVLVTDEPAVLAAAGLAVIAVAALAGARYAAVVIRSREITVGGRASAHRHALSMMPAPQHPATPGRPRTRAPSGSPAVA